MKCKEVEKNLNSFIREKLTGNDLRRTFYHLRRCPNCSEVLLDEFSFWMTFNDLDKDLDFHYKKNLDKFMDKIKTQIKIYDNKLRHRYILMSIIICLLAFVMLVIAIKIAYR